MRNWVARVCLLVSAVSLRHGGVWMPNRRRRSPRRPPRRRHRLPASVAAPGGARKPAKKGGRQDIDMDADSGGAPVSGRPDDRRSRHCQAALRQ